MDCYKLFSKENCPKCRILKEKLEQKNIKYELAQDFEELEKSGIKNLPVLKINDKLYNYYSSVCILNKY